MPDALRLALGTLTAIRVPAPREVTRTVAGRAMLLAPLVGAMLGLLVSTVPAVVGLLSPEHRTRTSVDLLTSVLSVGLLALLTRGLHLDGLADTADGLGVKGTDAGVRERRLAVMRAPDTGAFGVVAVVFVVVIEVTAVSVCIGAGLGTAALIVAAATGRLGATWCSTTGVTAARPDGLGATVAGSVPRGAAWAVSAATLIGAALLGMVGNVGPGRSISLVGASLLGLGATALVLRHCQKRFGGVTGDVLGSVVEISTAAVLVAIALAVTI